MRRIEVTYSTMGQGNPYTVGEHKDYTWNGDPAKSEAARTARPERARKTAATAGGAARSGEKAKRLRVFTELRANGVGVFEAGARVGVKQRAARRYEQQRLASTGEGQAPLVGYQAGQEAAS